MLEKVLSGSTPVRVCKTLRSCSGTYKTNAQSRSGSSNITPVCEMCGGLFSRLHLSRDDVCHILNHAQSNIRLHFPAIFMWKITQSRSLMRPDNPSNARLEEMALHTHTLLRRPFKPFRETLVVISPGIKRSRSETRRRLFKAKEEPLESQNSTTCRTTPRLQSFQGSGKHVAED